MLDDADDSLAPISSSAVGTKRDRDEVDFLGDDSGGEESSKCMTPLYSCPYLISTILVLYFRNECN